MIVYHGTIQVVEEPDINHSSRALDFGRGFYVTTNYEQAVKWARRKAVILNEKKGIVNKYQMNEFYSTLKVKDFGTDLNEWIDFVCRCRDESEEYKKYDVIIGKVADDKVFRVVDMYHSGVWDKERALQEIKAYPTYDQIAFISQKAIDDILEFQSYEEV